MKADYSSALVLLKASEGRLYTVAGAHFVVLPGKRILLVSTGYAAVKGYRSPPVLGLVLNATGMLEQVLLVRSLDNRPHLRLVGKSIGRILGQSVSAEKRPALAISGATRSADGVTGTLNGTLNKFAPIFADLALGDAGVTYKKAAVRLQDTLKPAKKSAPAQAPAP